MRVVLLGPVTAESGEGPLRLGGLKQRAVFALLTLNARRVVPLDRFVDELWPAEPPSRATLGLQSYVSRLRRMLAASDDPEAPRLLTRPPGWLLDLDPASVDVVRFETLLAQARHAPAPRPLLAEALALWQGEPLADLQEIAFAREEAARLNELRLSAEELALDAALSAGDADTAASARFVAANPFREQGVRALALGLYRSGRQPEALAAITRLRHALADELGLDPSTETQSLESGILRHDPTLTLEPPPHPSQPTAISPAPPAATSPVAVSPAPPVATSPVAVSPAPPVATSPAAVSTAPPAAISPVPPAATSPTSSRRFSIPPMSDLSLESGASGISASDVNGGLLGRDVALAAVDFAVARGRDGQGTLLVLEGLAGAGKTTLLEAVAERVAAAGGQTVHGSGVGTGATPALWPWVTIVREIAERMPDSEPGDAARHALDLMRAGGPAATTAPNGSQTRLFRGVVDLLLAAHRRAPLGVVLDDLQWVDPDSLTLLALAVDQLTAHGVVFAVAVRVGEPGADAVAAMLQGVRRDTIVRPPLPGLAVQDVAEIVRRLSGRVPDTDVAAAVHRRTLGNPFFVGELVRLLSSEQRLDPAAVHEALPTGVEEVLKRRLERLPQQTVALLTVAALAGGPVDVDTLAAVTGLDADAVLDACETALLAELLVEDGPGFALRHDLVRQTLERGVSQARRVRLHARLAETLRTRGVLAPPDVVAVARHLTLAEPVVGPAAVPFLAAAADDAVTRNAYREAERLLEQALSLATRAPDRAEAARLTRSVQSRLFVVRIWSGGPPSETGTTDEPDPAESTAGWVNALVTRAVTGRYGEVVAIAERALASRLDPAAEAAAHFVAGWGQTVRGRLDEASTHLRAYETLDASLPTSSLVPAVRVAAAGYAAVIAHCQGDDDAANRASQSSASRAAGNENLQMEADLYASWLLAMRGNAESCRRRAAACARTADAQGHPQFGRHAHVLLAWSDTLLGDPSAAFRADEAYEGVAASGVLLFEPFYLLLRAEAHLSAGRTDRASELVAEASARSSVLGDVCLAPRLVALAARVQGSRKP
ncbi:AfsR/SARP family transcriptional regulator [Actinoplanes solisilvae]|uniref:AfsR/SARP family transcriptional regulator n=1 Tax=Actinoplanes solisilvae TaxID=2486853 RepID=UPI000FD76D89|nr:AfsR/SARP family transcriptional regulator [Actinoplanes solisilvae]